MGEVQWMCIEDEGISTRAHSIIAISHPMSTQFLVMVSQSGHCRIGGVFYYWDA